MNIADLLPMLPWEGPPLPRLLGIRWPFGQQGAGLPQLSTPQPIEGFYRQSQVLGDIITSFGIKGETGLDQSKTIGEFGLKNDTLINIGSSLDSTPF